MSQWLKTLVSVFWLVCKILLILFFLSSGPSRFIYQNF
jgi:hypothetical protein